MARVSSSRRRPPLSFDDEVARAGVTGWRLPETRPVRVRRIVGSAGKAEKLGADFLPRQLGSTAKLNFSRVLKKMSDGQELPPVTLYQIGHRYFVMDGHTRVAAARRLGIEFLDAVVTEAVLPRT